jgi:hypothetical protein
MTNILKFERQFNNLYYLDNADEAVQITADIFDRHFTVIVCEPEQVCLGIQIFPVIYSLDDGKLILERIETRLYTRATGAEKLILGSLHKLDARDIEAKLGRMVEDATFWVTNLLKAPASDVELTFINYDA